MPACRRSCCIEPYPVGLAFALRYYYDSDNLGSGVDGINSGQTTIGPDGNPRPADGNEVGYQYLDTRFTGTSAARLSGDNTGSGFTRRLKRIFPG